MKKYCRYLVVLIACFLFIPIVSAQTTEHFYTSFGDDVKMSEEINASSFSAGGSLESTSKVRGINVIAGNNINHSGESDYLAAFGNSIDVSGVVFYDTVIAGNIISFDKDVNLQRDVIIFGADVSVKGNLERNVTIYAEKVDFAGANIRGDVKVYSDSITVDDNTSIGGTLSYLSDASASVSSNVKNVKKMQVVNDEETIFDVVMDRVISYASLILIFALLALIFPKLFEKIQSNFEVINFNKGIETIARGIACLIIVPLVAVALLVIPFAVPLSFITIALYIIGAYISRIFAAYLIGYKLWQRLVNKDINTLVVGLLGFGLLFVLSFIPVLGSFVSMCTLICGIGIMYDLLATRNN